MTTSQQMTSLLNQTRATEPKELAEGVATVQNVSVNTGCLKEHTMHNCVMEENCLLPTSRWR